MLEDADDLAILDGVLGLVKAFRREVIAEGVESIEHGKMLLKLGCEKAQGYIIAHPMPAKDIISWIEQYEPNKEWMKVPTISRDKIPLLYARVEHKAWRNNVVSYLKDVRKIPPKLNHKECRFGEWLHDEGKKEYAKQPVFVELEKLHYTLHDVTNDIIDKYKNNTLADLQASIQEINSLSQELTDILKKIEKEEF